MGNELGWFGHKRVKGLRGISNCLLGMSEVGNFSIHGSERRPGLALALVKGKLWTLPASCWVLLTESQIGSRTCNAQWMQSHPGLEYIFTLMAARVYRGSPAFPFWSPVVKSRIKDAWEGVDLFSHDCFVDCDPR